MRHRRFLSLTAPFAAAFIFLVASMALVAGQQTPPARPPGAPPPKVLIPVSANSVASNPDAYYGETVTLTASVRQVFSQTAFVVAQQPAAANATPHVKVDADVLVLAPTIRSAVDPNGYVTVFGEIVKFDPAQISEKAKDYKLDLAPDVVSKYQGRPVLVATNVITSGMIDLTKRYPPPMTADEQALSQIMKKVAPAFAALRTAIDGTNAENAAENAKTLKQAFADTEAFWKSKGKADAIGWAQGARKQVDAIDAAIPGAKWDAAKASAGTLGQACQNCHGAYRERFDDGSYRIKTASGTR